MAGRSRSLGWLVDGVRSVVTRLVPDPDAALLSPPLTFTDDRGRTVLLRPYDLADFEALVEMYDDFDPTQRAQGTPPLREADVRTWLEKVLAGPSVVACVDDRLVGHVVFVPDGTDRHELAVFVHQDYQHAGIGTHLVRAGLGHAKREGVTYVWLSVEVWKRGAQKLYSNVGFSTVNPMGSTHRMSRYL